MMVLFGADATTMWFLQFGWLAVAYLGRDVIDRWLDRKFPALANAT